MEVHVRIGNNKPSKLMKNFVLFLLLAAVGSQGETQEQGISYKSDTVS